MNFTDKLMIFVLVCSAAQLLKASSTVNNQGKSTCCGSCRTTYRQSATCVRNQEHPVSSLQVQNNVNDQGHASLSHCCRIVCLKGAVHGQDQKLKGLYHTAYSTIDDYRCYIKFNQADVKLLPPAVVAHMFPAHKNTPTMPSYDGKLVYFINNASMYMPLVATFNKKGQLLRDILNICATVAFSGSVSLYANVANSWRDAVHKLSF